MIAVGSGFERTYGGVGSATSVADLNRALGPIAYPVYACRACANAVSGHVPTSLC
jgi:hypothetical protein